jgi:hypothetical protein
MPGVVPCRSVGMVLHVIAVIPMPDRNQRGVIDIGQGGCAENAA